MPVGLICNCASVLVGGVLGALAGRHISDEMKHVLTALFGVCALSIGVTALMKVTSLTPVIMAVLAGTAIGVCLKLETRISALLSKALAKLPLDSKKVDMERFMTVAVIFCASGTGIFGVLTEGMSGDASILLSKSVLDLFTAAIFAATLGYSVSVIAVPQLLIFLALFFASRFVSPLITASAMGDFMACGGILTICAGLRMANIKSIPIANMIPALLLVIPLSMVYGLIF